MKAFGFLSIVKILLQSNVADSKAWEKLRIAERGSEVTFTGGGVRSRQSGRMMAIGAQSEDRGEQSLLEFLGHRSEMESMP
jgi:hypothetical protein